MYNKALSVDEQYSMPKELLRNKLPDLLGLVKLVMRELILLRVRLKHILQNSVFLVDVRDRVPEVHGERRGDGERLRGGGVRV